MTGATSVSGRGAHDAIHPLALGSAQFGLRYGIANALGQVPVAAVAAILRCGLDSGLDTIDTAVAYGASEACLGEVGVTGWRVVTKLPPMPDGVTDASGWVAEQVRGSLQRLRLHRLDALLLHRPADLHGARGAALLRAIEALKAGGQIGAAGISIYAPEELDRVWPLWRPDIVQAPCSVLDRRLIRSGWLGRLKSQGTRVHFRSVFLQGLLLMPASRRPVYFDRWRGLLDGWSDWCLTQKVSPLSAALAFACGVAGMERIVVGVESVAQLQEILAAASGEAPIAPDYLASDDRDLLEPSRWRLS
jgi:hypothetical protein